MDINSSYPNVAPMHDILQDALDDLVSSRLSTACKGDALVAIEHVLAQTSDPRAEGLPAYFNMLQDTFQCNVSSRIIAWTAATCTLLDKCLNKGYTDPEKRSDVGLLAAQLAQGMAIIQGVALIHKPSKQFLGRRYPLEVLLDLLLVSRHLSSASSPSPSTPTSPKAGISIPPTTKTPEVPLASIIIDTLLCILVDSIPALRAFEELNGVQVVVKILKRAGTPREVRMKCLEFLYFYLLDETNPLGPADGAAAAYLSVPDTPAKSPSPSHRSHSSVSATSQTGYSTGTSSRSSSGSSAFSVLSTSTTATSASLHDSPLPTKPEHPLRASRDLPSRSTDLSPTARSVFPGFTPSPRTVTPPASGAGALGRGQPRSLLMLKKEVDYQPESPKKPQLTHLSRGPSGLRPKLTERSNLGSVTPKLRVSRNVRSSEDAESEQSHSYSEQSAGSGVAVRTPRMRTGTGVGLHSRGLSVSSISSVSSTGSSPPHTDSPASALLQTPAKGKARETRTRAPFETPKASSKHPLHRRAQSLADFSSGDSPAHSTPGPRSASSPTAAGGPKLGPRTMEEKKEILGTMLGNVDALVEGVKKAGVWGLN